MKDCRDVWLDFKLNSYYYDNRAASVLIEV